MPQRSRRNLLGFQNPERRGLCRNQRSIPQSGQGPCVVAPESALTLLGMGKDVPEAFGRLSTNKFSSPATGRFAFFVLLGWPGVAILARPARGDLLSKWFYVLFAMAVVFGFAVPVIALWMDAFARRPPRD
jgi:hypothetical protein